MVPPLLTLQEGGLINMTCYCGHTEDEHDNGEDCTVCECYLFDSDGDR